jgi:methionyl-tRNA formyltransferase
MRLVFAGTPEVAVPALDALLASDRHEVVAVVTRPDATAGRGRKLLASPVAQRAQEAGIEVLKPARPRDEDFLARLREIGPDCCPGSPSTSRPTAGSTCTSRCCPPGAAPRPCSTP